MAKLVTKRTTTTVTEEVELVPAPAGAEIGHRFLTVSGYGDYYAADGSRVQLMGSQNLPDFPQRHPVVAQADALDQKHRRIKGIIPVTAVAAGGLYDALILIVLQQVGGNPQVFGEFSDSVFPDLTDRNHLRTSK